MNGSNVSEARTPEAIVIHLGYLTEAVKGVQMTLVQMATKDEINDLRKLITGLATKDQLDAEVKSIREEVQRNKPSALGKQVVVFCAGLAVIATALGFIFQAFKTLNVIVERLPPTITAKP